MCSLGLVIVGLLLIIISLLAASINDDQEK